MEILAPAKINLYLEVIERRPDGYHNIESIMQTVGLYDRLIIDPRPGALTMECSTPGLPIDERNLAMRAAIALKTALGTDKGAHIRLEKQVPMGAGLGGGSSDAAACLKGLLSVWGESLPYEQLVALGAKLGADVPFFLKGGAAVASGIGEVLEPLVPVPQATLILVNPGFPVATPGVYRGLHFPLTNVQKINKMKKLLQSGLPATEWGPCLFNRLEEVVLPQYPQIRRIKDELARLGAFSLMSGSGSTVFGIVKALDDGERIRSELKTVGWDSWLVTTVS